MGYVGITEEQYQLDYEYKAFVKKEKIDTSLNIVKK
jgi:hypothetical protein